MTSDPSAGGAVAEPVRVRRLTDQEGQKLQQTVRRGSTNSVRYRRAMMLATAGGNRVPVIAHTPAPAAKRAFAGADAPSTPRPDQPRTAALERRRAKFGRGTATEG
ncbi:hypothetical protein GCM10009864_68840 [Streptomyces lunalinharesii]|uniref:Transposase n=1 Tax=Streptomyces lunalinharesii TaxID=333384 RepID=A0ABP6F8T1_9ACTN